MKRRKNSSIFEVYVPHNDKMFRFYHDLEKYRNSYISFDGSKCRDGIARSLGKNIKPLVERDFVIPPLSRRHGDSITGIMLKHGVKVNGIKKDKGKLFRFLR